MLSVVIATHNCERALVRTLAMLVPAALTGTVRDVVIAEGGSTDETAMVADIAGCTVLVSAAPLAQRLRAAAAAARAPWLLFLRPGVVLDPGWADEAVRFADTTGGAADARAAVFSRAPLREGAVFRQVLALMTGGFGLPRPEQGLMLSRRLYDELGGHRDTAEPEADLLRRLGRRRIVRLGSPATMVPGREG